MVRGVALVTRPDHDVATRYGAAYHTLQIEKLKEEGYPVHDLASFRASKKEFDETTLREAPCLVSGIGHGRADRFTGWKNEPLLISCKYDERLVRARFFSLLSCTVGADLGEDMDRKDATVVHCYKDVYVFVIEHPPKPDPLEDRYAKWFLDSHNQFVYSLVDRKMAKEAFADTVKRYQDAVRYWSPRNPEIARYLFHDLRAMVMYGCTSCVIPPPEEKPPERPPPKPPRPRRVIWWLFWLFILLIMLIYALMRAWGMI